MYAALHCVRALNAAAKPALLAKLESASPQDAKIACFLCRKPITKIVIIINKLLTTAFTSILRALQVQYRLAVIMFVCSKLVHCYIGHYAGAYASHRMLDPLLIL